jgi:uncharacterized protein YkwD
MNWIDLVIVCVIGLYILDGFRRGFIIISLEIFGFFVSVFIALCIYLKFGQFIAAHSSISVIFAKLIAFFIIWLVVEVAYLIGARFAYNALPNSLKASNINKYSSFVPAIVKATIFVAIILTLLTALPISTFIRSSISDSTIGSSLVKKTAKIETSFEQIFGGVGDEALTFMAVKEPNTRINLGFRPYVMIEDTPAEQEMLTLINLERQNKKLKPLELDQKLHIVALAHAKDMLQRGYFAHESPEGKNVGNRLDEVGIEYHIAGENLALAPNVDIAHIGLMKSPTHRDNILGTDYHKIGIGVVNAGIYGEMFVQVYTD